MSIDQSLLLIIGMLITAGMFYLLLYFGFRRSAGLLFISLFCFCQAAKAFFRTDGALAMNLAQLTEAQCVIGTRIVYPLGSWSLLAFIIIYLEIPRRSWWLLGSALLIGGLLFLQQPILPFVIVIGLGLVTYTFKKEPLGSGLIALGLAIFGLTSFIEMRGVARIDYYIGILSFILTLTIFIGYQLRLFLRQRRQALLRTATLENQLLKRSLQPHFLFNSLMSLQEWIETNPTEAAQFVQVLADEFRALCNMSGRTLIPMEEELAMCRSHLAIMGFRREAKFQLLTDSISGQEQIPPAVFHTLIENGLTHGFADRKEGTFCLRKTIVEGITHYELSNDGNSTTSSADKAHNGTGLRYVRARLEEAFPGRWELHAGPTTEGWCIHLSVPA
ncbi:MAG: histidine kinase [Bacteroidota bacterium]